MAKETLEDARKAVRRGLGRTRIINLLVGMGTGGLGILMMAVHAFGLDPDARNMGMVGIIALYAFGLLFVAVGGMMVVVALFLAGQRANQLIDLLHHNPEHIRSARRLVAQQKSIVESDDENEFGQHQLSVTTVHNRSFQLMLAATDVSILLRVIRARNPEADVRGI
jgi:hypothetical protein